MTLHDFAFCLFEDRALSDGGLRLALVSLHDQYPNVPIAAHRPNASTEFIAWASTLGNVSVLTEPLAGASSWNCKPHALLNTMRHFAVTRAMWIDSDMLIAGNFDYLIGSGDELVVAQEALSQPHQGGAARSEGWGFKCARDFGFSINSSLLCVSSRHRDLLERWVALLESAEYVKYQQEPFDTRPISHLGDQDVLQALLCSEPYAGVPVRFIRSGTEVIHSGGALGYSLTDRLLGLRGSHPSFIHAIGTKPWWCLYAHVRTARRGWRGTYRRLLVEVSPYMLLARQHRNRIGLCPEWLQFRSPEGIVLGAVAFGHFALQAWPLCAAATLITTVTRLFRVAAQRMHLRDA